MLQPSDAAVVAARFGLGDGALMSGPVARGELGQVWRLVTSHGVWAVKEPFATVSPADAEEGARYQEAVRAAGVCTPRLVRAGADVVADVGSATVRVFEWMDFEPASRWVDPDAVGQLLASIHQVDFLGASPSDPWFTEPVGAAGWDGLIDELTRAAAPFADRLAARRDELVALDEIAEPPEVLQTCHRDFVSDNVLSTAAGHLSIIDWDNSGRADPSHELAFALFEFGCDSIDRAVALYDAYVAAGGPGRIVRPGQFTMAIAVLGHLGELDCRRWLEPGVYERERVTRRLAEFLDQPLTLEFIDEVVAAVAGRTVGP